ncbi:tetratricopeptide repeat protein [Streptomyces sp. NBC_01571]|uniref:AfsR/SARP family transcriptional regulator n=1 Tax=Streptomyces sp. NBC_01571 TaxID=2975883 RepID=UPI00225ADA2C|nr:BTAD domain-containing putative transcriptional regulator [Streptomyces sp. NBC_01571]MCX4578336.1 tetratricopeptide repeat protein [Streptomyces sp. NBC_01571]
MALEPVRFMVLGPVRAWRGETELDLGRPKERALLALLLARADQPVGLNEIVDALWDHRPPHSAVNVVRRLVGALRRLLEPGLPARTAGHWLVRDAGGYRLLTDSGSLDLLRFRELCDEARRAVAEEDPARGARLFGEALSLRRGPVAAGIPAEVRAHAAFTALGREYVAAVREAADAALRADVPATVLPQLQKAAAEHPLDEPLLARLILALAADSRRSEALGTYRSACARLGDELGIDAGPELHEAHRTALLRTSAASAEADASPRTPGEHAAATSGPRTPTVVAPAQLPDYLATFTGRQTELADGLALLTRDAGPDGTVVISAIGGMAGIGKTTLAVHWAHQVAHRYPDGQLHVNLRGFDPSGAVMSPGEAVRGFLDALGVPPERVPHGVDAQAALYRSLLSGRRFLVLLDNARDTDQIRPLLPGGPGCLTIVTSRNQLSGLVAAHGAHSLTLRPFDAGQSRAFLVSRLGAARTEAEPRAVSEIVERCGGLPLALACVAARAATQPHVPLSSVAAELREAHGSLDAFGRSGAPADIDAVFSWSLGAVSPEAARLFRLLALHPGPDSSVPAAAALAGRPVRETRRLLAQLTGVHLIDEHAPGRYAFHDLLRAHAAQLVHAQHSEAERRAAVRRLFDHCLHTARAAARRIAPHTDSMPLDPPVPGSVPESPADDGRALAWLTAEYAGLLAVIGAAAGSDHDRLACLLTWSMEPFFDRRGTWHDWAGAARTALDAARRSADPAMEAHGLRALARVEGRLGHHDRSRRRLERALELFTGLGDDTGRAGTHRSLGWVCEQNGDLPGALRHNQLALDLVRVAGAVAAQASVLNSVGWYHALLGDHRQALSHCFEALPMLQDLGDRYGQAATWDSVAYAYQHLGRHPHALLGFRNALSLYRQLEVPYPQAETLTRLGDTHLAMGDHGAARTCWREALTILAALGHPDAGQVRDRLRERDEQPGLAPC